MLSVGQTRTVLAEADRAIESVGRMATDLEDVLRPLREVRALLPDTVAAALAPYLTPEYAAAMQRIREAARASQQLLTRLRDRL